jgi:hypothetical protein
MTGLQNPCQVCGALLLDLGLGTVGASDKTVFVHVRVAELVTAWALLPKPEQVDAPRRRRHLAYDDKRTAAGTLFLSSHGLAPRPEYNDAPE